MQKNKLTTGTIYGYSSRNYGNPMPALLLDTRLWNHNDRSERLSLSASTRPGKSGGIVYGFTFTGYLVIQGGKFDDDALTALKELAAQIPQGDGTNPASEDEIIAFTKTVKPETGLRVAAVNNAHLRGEWADAVAETEARDEERRALYQAEQEADERNAARFDAAYKTIQQSVEVTIIPAHRHTRADLSLEALEKIAAALGGTGITVDVLSTETEK